MSLRILLVHPGCDISVNDVHAGVSDGLRAAGCEVYDYALNKRIQADSAYLHYLWHKGKKQCEKPTDAQVLYKAGEGLVTRALKLMPDVVIVVSAMYLHPNTLELMRRAGIKVAILFTESPYMDDAQARLIPWTCVAWTNERTSARLGMRYLRHAWHPAIHGPSDRRGDPSVPAHQVVFVGTAFQERVDLIEAVDWTGIDLALYGEWGLLSKRSPLKRFVKDGYIQNAHTAALYQRATIGLNLYRTSKGFGKDCGHIDAADSLNPRAYELAATGCFSISDYRAEVAEVFGEAVPTFRRPEDLRPLIDRWLQDDVGRARLTAQAHQY